MAILSVKMPKSMVADTNSPQSAQAESAQENVSGKPEGRLNSEVKGIVSVAGLVIRLTVVLLPLGLLGWAGFRRVRPVVKSIRRRRKPAYKKKEKGEKREQSSKGGMGSLFGRKGKEQQQSVQKAGA